MDKLLKIIRAGNQDSVVKQKKVVDSNLQKIKNSTKYKKTEMEVKKIAEIHKSINLIKLKINEVESECPEYIEILEEYNSQLEEIKKKFIRQKHRIK